MLEFLLQNKYAVQLFARKASQLLVRGAMTKKIKKTKIQIKKKKIKFKDYLER